MNCDPTTLAEAAQCFCYTDPQFRGVMVYLLAQKAGNSMTPAQLAQQAACYCYDDRTSRAVITYLLCLLAKDGSGPCSSLSGAGDPIGVAAPDFIGQLYHDTTADAYYRSTGLTSADWTAIGGGAAYQDMQVAWDPTTLKLGEMLGFFTYGDLPGITKIQFLGTTSLAGFDIESMNDMTELDFPNLVSIDPTNVQGGYFYCDSNTALTSLSVPALASVGGYFNCSSNAALTSLSIPALASVGTTFYCDYNTALTSLSVPALASVGGDFTCSFNAALTSLSVPALASVGTTFYCESNTALTTVDVSSWVPTDGTTIDFSSCALNAASVELILRRCVLAGVTTCTINLSGGTNAGLSSLSVQGQTDAATLGVQLTINP